jgi:hypothetical protein
LVSLSVLSHSFILLKHLRKYNGPSSTLVPLPRHIAFPHSRHTAKSSSRHTAKSTSRHTAIPQYRICHPSHPSRHTAGQHKATSVSRHTAIAAQPHSQPSAPTLLSPKGTLGEEKIDKSDQPRTLVPPSELRKITRPQVQRNLPHPLTDAVDSSSTPTRVPLPRPNTFPLFSVFTPCPPELRPSSTLRPEHWQSLLQNYPDPTFVQNLVGIATHGARIGYLGPPRTIHAENHASALRIPTELAENIKQESQAGRIRTVTTFPPAFVVSPLGAAPKMANGTQTGWRRIHDLSSPNGSSVNDGIPLEFGMLTYQTLDDAIALIAKHGKGVKLHKRDLKDAFRKIPVSPYDYWLLLFIWDGISYVDNFLPFGLRTAPFLFNMFAEGLHWILEYLYNQSLVHYLDDFLLVGGEDESIFTAVCNHLGLEEKASKAMDGHVVDFTGIELDSEQMIARLPQDKLKRATKAVQDTLRLGYTSFKALRSMLGFLSFCARVVPLGRPFLRKLFNFARELSLLSRPTTRRRLSAEAIQDLRWWLTLLSRWTGVRLIHQNRRIVHLYTDASGTKGIGGWCPGGNAFSTRVPRRHRTKHINWKEAYAVLFAFAKWGPSWEGQHITIMCDNSAIVDAINKRSIRGDAINPLQLLFLTAALYDIDMTACWLSSEDNWIADSLSRFDFKRLANFQLDRLLDLSRREPGTPMFKLRQRLQDYFGTDLLQVPDLHTPSHGPSMNNSHKVMDTIHSQLPSNLSHTGSQKQSKPPNLRQFDPTSPAFAANTSTAVSPPPCLRMSGSSGCFVDPSAYSEPPQSDLALKSPRTFSSVSSAHSVTTTTMSISVPHSQQPSLDFSEPANLPGIPGTLLPTSPNYPVDPSDSSTKASSFTFPNQRPTNFEAATTFHYLPLETSVVPSEHSAPYFNVIPNNQRTRYLQHPAARSTRSGSRTNSHRHYSKPVSTPRHILATPSVEVQQTRPSQREYPGTRSREWVVGSQMQLTDTFPNQPRRLNSFPPTGNSMWPPRVRRAPLDSLPALTTGRTDPRKFRTPRLAFQRGCLAADTVLRAFGPVLG